MRIIGSNQPDPNLFRKLKQTGQNLPLERDAMILKLQVVILRAKQVPEVNCGFLCALVVTRSECTRNLSCQTRRQADQPFVVLLEQLAVDPGFGVEPLDKPRRHHLNQVLITGIVFAEQDQVIGGIIHLMLPVKPGARRDIYLASDNWFDPIFLRAFVEIDHPEHNPMVSDRHSTLSERFCAFDQPLDPAGPVQQAVFSMHMKMRKITHMITPSLS